MPDDTHDQETPNGPGDPRTNRGRGDLEWPARVDRNAMLARVLVRGRHLRRRGHRVLLGSAAAAVVLLAGVAAAAVIGLSNGGSKMQVDVAGPPPPGGSANTLHGRSPNQVYRWTGTVLANAEHGPQMCIGGVLTSMPPQCGGIPLAGFDWSQVPQDAQSAAGQVRWADRLTLTGTYDGRTFTITKPPAISNGGSESMPPANGQSDLPAPCPPPPGGWRVTDPSKVSITDYQGFTSYANSQPDLSAIWQDNTTPVAGYTGKPLVQRQPVGTVMVVAFTGDLAKHRADIAALWGGPVCVIERTPSKTQMAAFQERLQRPDVKAAGVDVVSSGQTLGDGGPTVAVTVLIEDAVTKAWFAANARDIPVTITGVLQPVS